MRGNKLKKRGRISSNSAKNKAVDTSSDKKESAGASKFFRITHEIPKGIRVLMGYTGIISLFYLLLIFISDTTLFFGFVVNGSAAKLIHFFFFISALIIFYGITYKKPWCYNFSIIIYSICLLNSVVSLFFIGRISDTLVTSMYSLIIPIFIITLLMNIVTLWYVYEKKLYFKDPEHQHKHSLLDDVFIYVIYIFYFIIIIFIIVFSALLIFSVSKNLADFITVTSGMDIADAEAYCENIPDTDTRDICFLAVVYNNKDSGDINKLCTSVDLGYYRFTCYKVAEQ